MAMTMAMAMTTKLEPDATELRVENVSKSYGGRQVVDAISMRVRPGEVVGLLGPNGAGKSTIFNIVVGRESPCGGSVLLGPQEITKLSLPHRARLGIGYMTQEASVFRGLLVHDNIRLILRETGVSWPPDAPTTSTKTSVKKYYLGDRFQRW